MNIINIRNPSERMEAIARSLHLAPKSSDFYAHLHIVDLYNVPLTEGECKIKWRFRGAVHLSAVEKSQIIDKAKEGTVGYLLQRASTTLNSRLGRSVSTNKPDIDIGLDFDSNDDTQEEEEDSNRHTHGGSQHRGRSALATLGKALLHPGQLQSNRRRRSSSPKVIEHHNDYGYAGSPSPTSRTPKQSQSSTFSPNQSQSHSMSMTPLSPTGTIVCPPSFSRSGTANSNSYLSRSQTGISFSQIRPSEDSFDPSSAGGKSSKFEPVTESKGTTGYRSLASNACSFDQHVICAVGIPLAKGSQHLQPCPVRLAVKHKVRVTPLPNSSTSLACAQRSTSSSHKGDAEASSSSASISRIRRTSGSNSPSSSTTSINSTATSTKELHEEIPLGEITLDLSEFVEAGKSAKRSERWISRRYLLQNGKTNALLRVAVKMEWISGEIAFTP